MMSERSCPSRQCQLHIGRWGSRSALVPSTRQFEQAKEWCQWRRRLRAQKHKSKISGNVSSRIHLDFEARSREACLHHLHRINQVNQLQLSLLNLNLKLQLLQTLQLLLLPAIQLRNLLHPSMDCHLPIYARN